MQKTTYEFTCDLCNKPANLVQEIRVGNQFPAYEGWDRTSNHAEIHVCNECMALLENRPVHSETHSIEEIRDTIAGYLRAATAMNEAKGEVDVSGV